MSGGFENHSIEGLRHARNLLQKQLEKERQRAQAFCEERDQARADARSDRAALLEVHTRRAALGAELKRLRDLLSQIYIEESVPDPNYEPNLYSECGNAEWIAMRDKALEADE